ncbi:MAG: hypothetical protein KatS3mg131_0695 [Candidatus Tectimicrobiota bacterium]|nr:MAG: hypothetical protein KatS3mg131_0695 [Candidatus Tectomicrobia bacterium]
MRLVLFDIDGTLLTTGGAGAEAMRRAFADLYGIADALAGIPMAGNTDRAIVQEALRRQRLPYHEAALQAIERRYLYHLRQTLQEPHRPRRLLPGVAPLLAVLNARRDLIVGLLTGNFAAAARLKLEAFGIWHYFRVGAYGSDAADRNALLPLAQVRAYRLLGQAVPASQTVVIGDTPRDIACARAHGARVIAVATGSYDLATLRQHAPDHCLRDLGDVPTVVRLITADGQSPS